MQVGKCVSIDVGIGLSIYLLSCAGTRVSMYLYKQVLKPIPLHICILVPVYMGMQLHTPVPSK